MPRINRINWLAIVFLFIVIILSGCHNDEKIDVVFFEPNDYQVYLYSKGNENKMEESYLSAILDLKIEHPDLMDNMSVKETSHSSLKQKDITEFPALLILKDGKIINILSGENNKQDILMLLEQAILTNDHYSSISS